MSSPIVSVVVPFFNAERFIAETLESVFAQSYRDWELLLVDDGSTDDSTRIALDYATKHSSKVRYVEHDGHQNRGTCASRNLGIRNARGEYIAPLDADDVWLPHKLERQVAILDAHPEVGMVYGAYWYWHSWTGRPEDERRDHIPGVSLPPNRVYRSPSLLTLSYPLGSGNAPSLSDLVVRREAVERVGGFEEDFRGIYQLYEDQAFLSKIYLNESVYVAGECWDRYRLHSDSCVSSVTAAGQYHTVRAFFLSWLENYFAERKVADPEVLKALENALYPYRHPVKNRLMEHTHSLEDKVKSAAKSAARRTLPVPARRWLRKQKAQRQGREYVPPVGEVDFGDLRRLTPLDPTFGYERGVPVDRYYIENFLLAHPDDIRGRALEIGDDAYTRRFGGDRVTQRDVLHVLEGAPGATFVGDLTRAEHLPSDAFDCFILTQTLHLIYDLRSALNTVYRILKPGGVVLATVPGISQIDRDDWGGTWYWCFTRMSARKVFEEAFPAPNVRVEAHGNVLAATSFLQGLAVDELSREELDYRDPSYDVLITVRAVKP